MSKVLVTDNDRVLGQLATNKGMLDMTEIVNRYGGPVLKRFCNEGSSTEIKILKEEVLDLIKQPIPKGMKSTFVNLYQLLEKAGTIVFVGE